MRSVGKYLLALCWGAVPAVGGAFGMRQLGFVQLGGVWCVQRLALVAAVLWQQ